MTPHDPSAATIVKSQTDGIEDALAAIWSEVLEVGDIRLDESFLDQGGDSISAALCVNRVRKMFGVEVPLGTLLMPDLTIGVLAATVRTR